MGRDSEEDKQILEAASKPKAPLSTPNIGVSLLTGGGDRHYAFGLATALIAKGATLDFIGSDDLDCPEFHSMPGMNFLNLRGDQHPDAGMMRKVARVSAYYAKLIGYAALAKPRIFHILWNNKFEFFDRTLLMLYYRLLGEKNRIHCAQCERGQAGFRGHTSQSPYAADTIPACQPHLRSYRKDET
jgi:hypothetical protein